MKNQFYAMQAFGVYATEGGSASAVKARDFKDATDLIVASTGKTNAEIMMVGCSTREDERPMVTKSNVRRLTPGECALLQGFPADWCDIGDWADESGKTHKEADSPKYKALGNSICTPFWFWLLRRISAQYERPATLGSLFSGIGGFEYCWARCNGSRYVLWSSEIEQFPIAVVKKHFGDEEHGIEGDIGKYL